MNKGFYEQFKNKYPVSKTLRFELIPQGKTLEYIQKNGLLEEDENRAKAYKEVKKIIDDYHREHIEASLSDAELTGLSEYERVYSDCSKSSDDLDKISQDLRKQIVEKLTTPKEKYNRLFSKNLIEEDLPKYVGNDEEKAAYLKQFSRFTTYFTGFYENRKNIYSKEAKSTAIAYRVIDQNLPKYIDNFKAVKHAFENEELAKQFNGIENTLSDLLNGKTLLDFFGIENYSSFLTQSGIDLYNAVIGGRTEDARVKTQGINEIINLFNQKHKEKRIGILTPLYKQILSERKTLSFLDVQFTTDEEVLESIKTLNSDVTDAVDSLMVLFENIEKYDLHKVYISNDGSIETISKSVYGDWNYIRSRFIENYDANRTTKKIKDYEKYTEKRDKEIRKNKSFSIKRIIDVCGDDLIIQYCRERFKKQQVNTNKEDEKSIIEEIRESFSKLNDLLSNQYPKDKKLAQDNNSIFLIKDYLDALKTLQNKIKPFKGTGKESEKDDRFYGEFNKRWDELDVVTLLYNRVRNYVTRKPYSTEKIKLNFRNETLLNGWDLNKEPDNTAVILMRDRNYYLGIMSKGNNRIFMDVPECRNSNCYEKMEYKLLPGPNKMLPKVFFSKSRIEEFNPDPEVVKKYRLGTHKKGEKFDINDCHRLIDFFKDAIEKHPDWKKFDFDFSDTKRYRDISDFYREVSNQGYKITLKKVSCDFIDRMVEEGKLYLFKIYNKDFSPNSKGTPNLHTLYWKMLFDKRNLCDVIYKLNGEAEVFYRKASIKQEDRIIHKANEPIKNKNTQNGKEETTFEYDIIKDKRYTVDKFQFHVPITMNFKADDKTNINMDVRAAIKVTDNLHVIGIDRGERNLLYICVVDSKGNIVEQKSLNQIITEHDGNTYITDYHKLLDDREKKRDEERKNWQSIETIKELKEGYLSIVIHEIVTLAVKYNAIIVLEDLNLGFMRGRQKVEKQVYQNFERMLINKLNYLVDKKLKPEQDGGLLNAYQLTAKFESFAKLGKQSGILFYTQAWNTSKIDPTTGFVNLFDTRYKSVEAAKEFWGKFNAITYDSKREMFCFDFNYSNFTQKAEGTKDHWIVYSNGERVESRRNHDGQWVQNTVDITEELKKVFNENGINYKDSDVKEELSAKDGKEFHSRILYLFRLILQMRNSISNSDIDYLISPVLNAKGDFYDSRLAGKDMPKDADANGAYNIARKGLMMINRLKESGDDLNADLLIRNKEWLQYAQGIK